MVSISRVLGVIMAGVCVIDVFSSSGITASATGVGTGTAMFDTNVYNFVDESVAGEGEAHNWNQNKKALEFLSNARQHVINYQKQQPRMKPCHYFPLDARNEFYNHLYSKLPQLHFDVIHYYNPCMSTYNLGNSLGNYLNEISCAAATNTSLIIGKKLWDFPTMPYEFKGKGRGGPVSSSAPTLASHNMALFDGLPELFDSAGSLLAQLLGNETQGTPQNFRVDADGLVKSTKALCSCEKYCWSDKNAPWINHYQ
jgi:hypothetical protein